MEKKIRLTRLYLPIDEIPDEFLITGTNAHYLRNVVRIPTGGEIETFDGQGTRCRWEIIEIISKSIKVRHIRSETIPRKSPLKLTLGLNPLKGGGEEIAVRIAASMDVFSLVPVIFTRSEIPNDLTALEKRIDRWKKWCANEVALSGGAYIPEIAPPVNFADLSQKDSIVVLFYEDAETEKSELEFEADSEVCALVGPEGGVEHGEVESALKKGFRIGSLGPWTMRAEYAGAMVPFAIFSKVKSNAI
ncbi:MAG: RsmE family RNA methyltransferase [bacterium]